jgi:hypothetical protein
MAKKYAMTLSVHHTRDDYRLQWRIARKDVQGKASYLSGDFAGHVLASAAIGQEVYPIKSTAALKMYKFWKQSDLIQPRQEGDELDDKDCESD